MMPIARPASAWAIVASSGAVILNGQMVTIVVTGAAVQP